ncbi:MAG: Uma2 family endonuclease [Chloroflexi bacterium CFX4]|nr:Uma2 family endonuclease [Chloroflexi bacterium CFX4]MDL1922291.1 Uma2 family endonuclease [Chloroflexi bacterium CFX3]
MTIQERLRMTANAFESWLAQPENAEKRCELIAGEVFERAPSRQLPTLIIALGSFVKARNLGVVTNPEGGFRLSDDDIFAPDVAFIARERIAAVKQRGFFTIPPDLAVEVLSPSDSVRLVQRKAVRYLALGVREVWLIYPQEQSAEVYRPLQKGFHVLPIGIDQSLEGGSILPDFSLPLREVFDIGYPITGEEAESEGEA